MKHFRFAVSSFIFIISLLNPSSSSAGGKASSLLSSPSPDSEERSYNVHSLPNMAKKLSISEEPGIYEGRFIFPNELRTYLYEPILKEKKDVLIAIGTFRGLFDAVIGNFDMVFLLDYDERTTFFNRAHLELIGSLANTGLSLDIQRYLYLCILAQRYVPMEKLSAISSSDMSEFRKTDSLFYYIRHAPRLEDQFDDILIRDLRLQKSSAIVIGIVGDHANNFDDYFDTVNGLSSIQQQLAVTHWSSDKNWAKIQNLIMAEKIVPVTGNIFKPLTLRSIAKYLRQTNQVVSVLDISNVLDHLFYYAHEQSKIDKLTKRLRFNMSSLPRRDPLEVLFTVLTESPQFRQAFQLPTSSADLSQDMFSYFSMPANFFLTTVLKKNNEMTYLQSLSRFYLLQDAASPARDNFDHILIRVGD